jgi:hypothetical protein
MVWSYFGSGHRKGAHDGVRAILKQEIKKEQLRMDGEKLQNVANVVTFCQRKHNQDHVAYLNARRTVSRFFHSMKREDVDSIAI